MKNKRMLPLCDSFYDFIIKINDWYGEIVAFKTTDKEWYYHDLYKAGFQPLHQRLKISKLFIVLM